MISRKWLWLSLAALTFLLSGLAYYLFIYRSAQSPIELQEPASRECSIPIVQRSQAIKEDSDIEVAPSTTPILAVPRTEVAEVLPSPTPTLAPISINANNATDLEPLYILTGLANDVTEVVFSPDGSLIASSSTDSSIRLWNAINGSPQQVLVGHTDYVLTLDFSPDGSLVASGSNDGTVRIWQVNDGTLLRTIDSYFMGRVIEVEFSPDGSLLAMADHLCNVQLRWVNSGILYRTLVQPNCVASQGGTVQAWGLAFSPDGDQIITGEGRPCCGGSLQLWQVDDVYTPPELLKGYNLQIRDLTYTPDESKIAVALLGSPVFWVVEAESRNVLQTFEGHTYRVNSVTFSPDGELLASGSRDQKVRLWRVEDGELIHTLVGHTDEVNSVAISPDGSLIASGSSDDTVMIWGIDYP